MALVMLAGRTQSPTSRMNGAHRRRASTSARFARRDEVFDNLRWLDTTFKTSPGKHILKLIMIDPEIVVEQIVVNPDNTRYSYFGAHRYK